MTKSGRTRSKFAAASPAASVAAFLLIFTGALEGGGMSIAGHVIAADLRATDLYPWIYTTFMLSSVVGIVSIGLVSGRRASTASAYGAATAVIVIGGLVSACAPTMLAFLSGRALQGVAVGGLTVLIFTWAGNRTIGPARSRALALLGSAGALGVSCGPAVTSVLVLHTGWRAFIAAITALLLLGGVLIAISIRPSIDQPATIPTRSRMPRSPLLSGLAAAIVLLGAGAATTLDSTITAGLTLAICAGLLWYAISRGGRDGARDPAGLAAAVAGTLTGVYAVAGYGLATALGPTQGVLATGLILSTGAVGWFAGTRVPMPDLSKRDTIVRLTLLPAPALAVVVLALNLDAAWWALALLWTAAAAVFGWLVLAAQNEYYARGTQDRVSRSAVLQLLASLLGAWLMVASDSLSHFPLLNAVLRQPNALLNALTLLATLLSVVAITLAIARYRTRGSQAALPRNTS